MKGYTARLLPPSLIDSHTWLRIPTNHSVGTASRTKVLPLRTQLFEVCMKKEKGKRKKITRLSLMSSQDKHRVTNHPVGVTKHPAWSNNNLHLAPLLGPLSPSIKHRLFNCLLTRALSGGPSPTTHTVRQGKGNNLVPKFERTTGSTPGT